MERKLTATPFPYRLNKKIRLLAMRILSLVTGTSREDRPDLQSERIERILLIRANFRMGNSILAIPAIFLFRRRFPHARIDFVGSPISRVLCQELPIDHHYQITRRFPDASWAYLILLKQIRSVGYDLAVELTCASSALGSFIAGFSAARYRVGSRGRWDLWFNVKVTKPPRGNKYQAMPLFLTEMGLDTGELLPSLILSATEKEEGKNKLNTTVGQSGGPIVGVFVGGRKGRGKRWPIHCFLQLTESLCRRGVKVIVFIGPEEKKLKGFFRLGHRPHIPLVFEPSLRIFASMISNCNLFITCDSGPMHLASAVGVRTVAIFQNPNFGQWAPPPGLARIVYQDGGVSAEEVLEISLAELSDRRVLSRPEPSVQPLQTKGPPVRHQNPGDQTG